MATGVYIGVNSVARKVKKLYIGVNGIARKVKKVYMGINNVARLVYKPTMSYVGTVAPLSEARYALLGVSTDSMAMFAGGYKDDYQYPWSATLDAYNSSFVRSSVFLGHGVGMKGAAVGDFAFIASGQTTTGDTTVAWRVSSSTLARNNLTLTNKCSASCGVAGNSTYALFGGGRYLHATGGEAFWSTVDCFNASTLSKYSATLSVARGAPIGVSSVTKSHAILAGGLAGGTSTSSTVDAFDTSLTRTTLSNLSYGHARGVGVNIGNHTIITGGYRSLPSATVYGTDVNVYNSNLVKVTNLTNLDLKYYCTADSTGDYAILSGEDMDTVLMYDINLTRTTLPSIARYYAGAVAAVDKSLLLAGGRGHSSYQYYSIVERFSE